MNTATAERQLELTINALCRSLRRTVRLAEREDPAGTDGIWKAVEHRAALLQQMLAAAGEFTRKPASASPSRAAQAHTAGKACRGAVSAPAAPVQVQEIKSTSTPDVAAPPQKAPAKSRLTRAIAAEILGVSPSELKYIPGTLTPFDEDLEPLGT